MARPIWIVGMMGSGKSTVAPLVATALGRQWMDSDTVVEDQTQRSVEDLFAESEALFRAAEVEAIRMLASGEAVVATGGGAVMTEAAEIMRSSGVIVWLRAEVDTLEHRVGAGSDRPLINGDGAALQRIDIERRGRYASLSDVVVDTDDIEPEVVANLVVEAWAHASSEV